VPRRLPVIQNEAPEDALVASRPRFQWILIGAGLCFAIWAPLAIVTTPLGARLGARAVGLHADDLARGLAVVPPNARTVFALVSAAPLLVSFLVASLAAGALVGRFGRRARRLEAALGGLLAAVLVSALGFRGVAGLPVAAIIGAFSVLSLLGVTGGALGGTWGRSGR